MDNIKHYICVHTVHIQHVLKQCVLFLYIICIVKKLKAGLWWGGGEVAEIEIFRLPERARFGGGVVAEFCR